MGYTITGCCCTPPGVPCVECASGMLPERWRVELFGFHDVDNSRSDNSFGFPDCTCTLLNGVWYFVAGSQPIPCIPQQETPFPALAVPGTGWETWRCFGRTEGPTGNNGLYGDLQISSDATGWKMNLGFNGESNYDATFEAYLPPELLDIDTGKPLCAQIQDFVLPLTHIGSAGLICGRAPSGLPDPNVYAQVSAVAA